MKLTPHHAAGEHLVMKRLLFSIGLMLSLVGIGHAQERDPKSFYLDGGLKLTPVQRTPHILESLLNIHIGEFDIEMPDANSSLTVTLGEATGQAVDYQADSQRPLKELHAVKITPWQAVEAKGRLIIAFTPMRDDQVSNSLFSAPDLKVMVSYPGLANSDTIKNPLAGFNSSQIYMAPTPAAAGHSSGSVPRQKNDAIGLMRFFKTRQMGEKMVSFKDIFLKFTVTPYKKP
jgi:hypothetical protein